MPKNSPKPRFRTVHSKEQRQKMAKMNQQNNPESILAVIERDEKQLNLPELANNKFIIEKQQNVMQVLASIKSRLIILDENMKLDGLNFSINKKIVHPYDKISQVYEKNKNEDQILYFQYSAVDSF